MESKPQENEQELTGGPTEGQRKESDYTKSTRHSAENAKRLGLGFETFQALSLRDRTALSFLDVPEDYQAPEESQDENDQLIFMDTGAKYGEAFFPYTPEIQRRIHNDYLLQNLRSSYFGQRLIEENEAWQERIVEERQKTLTAQATTVFREIMRSKYAEPSKLMKTSGLETEEFLELIQLEDKISQESITTEFLTSTNTELSETKSLSWHLDNARYYEKAYTDVIAEEDYSRALEDNRHETVRMRSIKRLYDILIEKKTKKSYRPLKYNYVNPFRVAIKYYAEKEGEFFQNKRKYVVELDKRFKATPTSLKDAIDSVALFCEENGRKLDLGDIDLKTRRINKSQIDEFIEKNAIVINDYFNEHFVPFRKARAKLDTYTTSLRLQQPYLDDSEFKEALESSPFYEKTLHEIYQEARYLDIINIIYGNASKAYIAKIKLADNTDEKTTAILEQYNLILNHAQEAKIPLRGETCRLEEARSILSSEFGIEDDITEQAEDIIHNHHQDFSAALYDGIRIKKEFRTYQSRYYAQKKAQDTLAGRIRLANNSSQNPIQRDEYYAKLEKLSEFSACVRQLKQSIRSDFYTAHKSRLEVDTPEEEDSSTLKLAMQQKRELDLIQNTLNLPFNLYGLNLPPREELTTKLKEQVETYHISGDPDQYVQDLIANETRSCELKIKLALGSKRGSKRDSMTRRQRNRDFSEAQEEYYQYLFPIEVAKQWASNYTKQTILESKIPKIAQLLGYTKQAKSVLFTPGYMIVHDSDDHSEILPIDPEKIAKSTDSELNELAPFLRMPPFSATDEIATARSTLNRILETEMLKNEAVGANTLERRIIAFRDKTGISFPQAGIEPSTGQLRTTPTEAEMNGLETIYPFFGRFFTGAEKTVSYYGNPEALIEAAQKAHRDFICNESQNVGYILFQNRSRTRYINLENLANLLRAKSIDSAKALELLAYDAAICDFTTLDQDEINQYQRALKGKIPADARTFMLLYQKPITSPLELQKCGVRLSYCREFAKYCAGNASTPELRAFFDERVRKIKGAQQ